MKKKTALPVLLLLLLLIPFACEDKYEVEQKYSYFEPIYTTAAEIRASVGVVAPQEIKEAGKIYIKDNWLFVNEVGKGIHVIDNSNPKAPVIKNFLNIPGNYDLAVKGNILYADSYIDLVAIDISDKSNIKIVKRLEGIFSVYNRMGSGIDPVKGIITSWKEKENVTVTTLRNQVQPWGGFWIGGDVAAFSQVSSMKTASVPGNPATTGIGGSMARFTIEGDYLYMLDAGNVHSVSIKTLENPIAKSKNMIAWDIETIFPHEGKLFFGAQSGMYIFELDDPEKPTQISRYAHVRSCDPVVVEGDLAYVTLRSGTTCQGFTNQLEVIDIKDLTNPVLLKIYPMTNPHGLGIDNKNLFICDGDDGLKIYDATDHLKISDNQLAHYKNINTYDVIPYNNVAIMTGKDGIYQFDYSKPKDIKLLSKVTISNQ
ncbi:MAG: LVIVD repeat-containing protein [Flammeovirgaceae bacterium]